MNLENCFRSLYLQTPDSYHEGIRTIYKQAKENPASNLYSLVNAQMLTIADGKIAPEAVLIGMMVGFAIAQMSSDPVFEAELIRGEKDEDKTRFHIVPNEEMN